MATPESRCCTVTTWFGTRGPDLKTGSRGDDFLVGRGGDDTLRGQGGDDVLNGQKGANRLSGGAGNDRIYASGGDRVWGGADADVFVFLDRDKLPQITDPGTGQVMDFDAIGRGHDVLDLSHFAIRWDDRDAGLGDGFEMLQRDADVVIRLKGAEGSITRIVLHDVVLADIDKADILFG